MSDYYSLLGCSRTSSVDEIKKAYRKAAMKHHPDKGGDEAIFKKISHAFDVLSDPKKKERYDRFGTESDQPEIDPTDIFNSFFGDSPFEGFFKRHRQNDTIHNLSLSLEDLYIGKSVQFSHSHTVRCDKCHANMNKCSMCRGTGKIVMVVNLAPGIQQRIHQSCQKCDGKGFENNSCNKCNGKGFIKENRKINFDIKPGSSNDERYIIKEMGNFENGFQTDLVVVIKEISHPRLKRSGDDLILEHTIDLYEALTGVKFRFKHLDGKAYIFKSPENLVVNNESKYKIDGLGMKKKRLLIKFDIIFPTRVITQKELLSKALDIKPREFEETDRVMYMQIIK